MLKKRRLGAYRAGIMTLPDERYRSMMAADRLLRDLCDSKVTPRVPRAIRDRVIAVLRHWPGEYYINRLAHESPEIIETAAAEPDPLYKIVKEYKGK